MTKPKILAAFAALFLAPTLLAQTPCSKLEVKGSGDPGTKLTISLSGAAKKAKAWVMVGVKEGNTSIKIGPLGTLNLGLGGHLVPMPIGHTDGRGHEAIEIRVPNGLPRVTVFLQGFTSELKMTRKKGQRPDLRLEFCTSNVVKVTVGRAK
ncbi:MAG: hypothetical protein ACYST0_14395 [Planctomycetota bacterium]|jgi:hypothetical protein